jgi:hypothetical protein
MKFYQHELSINVKFCQHNFEKFHEVEGSVKVTEIRCLP